MHTRAGEQGRDEMNTDWLRSAVADLTHLVSGQRTPVEV
jgi:hypothetical protein